MNRNDHSIWFSRSFDQKPDVVVVGGGIVGLFTALYHKRRHPQHHVMVLEKGPYPFGASVRNAGFACFGSPSELIHDLDHEGTDATLQRVELRWRGLQELRRELGDEPIGLEVKGGHEIFPDGSPLYPRVTGRFDELNDMLRPILGPDTFQQANDLIGSFGLSGTAHLISTPLEAQLDSGKLMSNLLRLVRSEDIEFRGNSHVRQVNESGGDVEIVLDAGPPILAGQVVLCVNAWTRELAPELDVVPGRGQVLLTGPIPGLRISGTFHFDEGYYYFRDLDGAVLLGGGRNLDLAGESTVEEGMSPQIQEALERMLREVILPGQDFQIARRWSGAMAFGSQSKTPLIQRRSERVVVAARLGGMGVAIGILVARHAADLLADRETTAS
jgi:gamma-glutamylputrescine oxidase